MIDPFDEMWIKRKSEENSFILQIKKAIKEERIKQSVRSQKKHLIRRISYLKFKKHRQKEKRIQRNLDIISRKF